MHPRVSEHYKNTAEHNKAISKLETDRDAWQKRAEDAEETLKGFEGVDPAQVQSELDTWKKKAVCKLLKCRLSRPVLRKATGLNCTRGVEIYLK